MSWWGIIRKQALIGDLAWCMRVSDSMEHYNGIIKYSGSKFGPRFNIKNVFPVTVIPVLKIEWSRDRLIFNILVPILERQHLYIDLPSAAYDVRMTLLEVIGMVVPGMVVTATLSICCR